MNRAGVLFALVSALVVIGMYLICSWSLARKGSIEKAEALLRGDKTAQLQAFEIDYQQLRVRCTDPEALRYLESCLHEGDPLPPNSAGLTYRLRLEFASGGSLEVTTYWCKRGFTLYMPYQATDTGESPRGGALFKSPMPASVKEMIDFLNDDSGKSRAMVLILEPGAGRREHDPSLYRP